MFRMMNYISLALIDMELKLYYAELEKYVQAHHSHKVKFERLNDRTLKISYIKKILITMTVSVKLKIIDVVDNRLLVGIDSNIGLDAIISRVLKFILRKFPEYACGISVGTDHVISIDLTAIDKAKPVAENLNIQSIRFSDTHLTLSAGLK